MTKLQALRKAKGLSQSELAAVSGVSLKTIQNYELPRYSLRKAQAVIVWQLAQALGCQVGELFEDD